MNIQLLTGCTMKFRMFQFIYSHTFSVFQVISTTVANALDSFYGQEVQGTVKFIRMFDKFFDCLNTRSLTEADRNRKPNVAPYKSPNDQRLKVINFLEVL